MPRIVITPLRRVPGGRPPACTPVLRREAPRPTDEDVRHALRNMRARQVAARHPSRAHLNSDFPPFIPGKTTTAGYIARYLNHDVSHLAGCGMHEGKATYPDRWCKPAPYLTPEQDLVIRETEDEDEYEDLAG